MVDADRRSIEVTHAVGFLPERGEGCRLPLGVGITGAVARRGRARFVPDVRTCPGYIPGVAGARWEMAIPLAERGGAVLGVVDVESAGSLPDDRLRRHAAAVVRSVAPAFAGAPAPLPPRLTRTTAVAPRTADDWRRAAATLATTGVRCVYQPIFDLARGEAVGAEALLRGPRGTPWESPGALFAAAEAANHTAALDAECMRAALAGWPHTGDTILFVNVHPASLHPGVREGLLRAWDRLAARRGDDMPPIVVELTEHADLRPGAAWLLTAGRARGVRFAVDDFGSGYANAQTVLALRPAYIKLDAALIRGVDRDFGRRSYVESLAYYTARTHTRLIAEGVETEDELRALLGCGVRYAQGYLLARPTETPQRHPNGVASDILSTQPWPAEPSGT